MPEEDEAIKLYNELNERGRAFVDSFAIQYHEAIQQKGRVPFGVQSARILAIQTLAMCWDGRVPE